MAYNFNNLDIKQIYEDFADYNKVLETYKDLSSDDVEVAFMDLMFESSETAFDEAKDKNEKAKISDDVTYLMSACNDKFAKALMFGGDYQEAWAEKFATTLEEAIDANPNNIPSILDSVLKIEKTAEFSNYGILNTLTMHIINKHQKYAEKALAAVDEHFANYDKEVVEPKIETYQEFYDVYTTAFRKPRSKQMADKAIATANQIYSKMEFMKSGMKLDKSIESIKANPEDEKALQNFEKDLQFAMRVNPEKAIANVVDNLREIAAVGNDDTRGEMYSIICDAIEENVPGESEKAKKFKSDLAFSFVGKSMKTEKNPVVRENMALSVLGLLRSVATDENGALIMADGKEPQAFGALSKIADACGHRSELLQVLSDTAEKYKDTPDMLLKVKEITMRALDSADDSNRKMQDYDEPDYIKEMRAIQRPRRLLRLHNTEICALLNIEYAKSEYKFDASKPLKPSRKDLLKAANLLSQYKSIDPVLYRLMLNRMDSKTFANVDDKVIDAFSKALNRVNDTPEKRKEFEKELTEKRTQMHTQAIMQKKVNADAKPPHYVEKRNQAEKKEMPKFVIKFDKEDVNEG